MRGLMPSRLGHRTAHSAGRRVMTLLEPDSGFPNHGNNHMERAIADAASTLRHSERATASRRPGRVMSRDPVMIEQKKQPVSVATNRAAAPLPAVHTICPLRQSDSVHVWAGTPVPSGVIPFPAAPYPESPVASARQADPAVRPTAERNSD
ncbi:hypothetical protein PEC301296_01200 [Pectobacterium carotovorum subsp. carotovorum]|nr:hypothetical protein EV46_10085 [Pectobacterium atrosepticum]POW29218.1 hypothetical protein PB72LOC_02013 [Pectobacterium atrosepticum]GKV83808.1 hypothetical protein PEC301296_01200 [Pectobacterium carotovorum subsp. carotovorum]